MPDDPSWSPLEAIGRVAAGFQFAPSGAGGRVWEQLRPWIAQLTLSAVPRWLPRLVLGAPCHVAVMRDGATSRCPSHAVGACVLCRQPTCLSHSFVNAAGDVACFVCISKQTQGATGAPPPDTGARPRRPTEEDVKQAARILGVRKNASWPRIQKAYREKVKTAHPDRGGSAEEFHRVQRAFDLLKSTHEDAT